MGLPEQPSVSARKITEVMLALLRDRGASTACPSEVARALDPQAWRPLMPAVRKIAAALQEKGRLDAYQRGREVKVLLARGPIRLRLHAVVEVDHRKHPDRYRIGRGEQGVLTVQPYSRELLPLWRFRNPEVAAQSAQVLWRRFQTFGKTKDFVGMDIARKFLQMGWTRSRRYANHSSGRKYKPGTRVPLPPVPDEEKAASAAIFRRYLQRALKDPAYLKLKREHLAPQGTGTPKVPRRKKATAEL